MQLERTLVMGLILSSITTPVFCMNYFHKCVTSTGWKLRGPADTTFAPDDILPCFYSCVRSSVCHAAYFSSVTQLCHHHTRDIIKVDKGTVQDHVAFVRNVPGIIAGDTPRYQYTYTDAMDACASLGGRLMTSQELNKVYQDGYELCRCGWLDGNLIQFPMQTLVTGCGGIGLIDCAYFGYTGADAWCQI